MIEEPIYGTGPREDTPRIPGEKTLSEAELRDPFIITQPLSFANWRLRVMVLDFSRRYKVLAGGRDPTPGEPWRVCDPDELRAWLQARQKPGDETPEI